MLKQIAKFFKRFLFIEETEEKEKTEETAEVTSSYEVPMNRNVSLPDATVQIRSIDPRSYTESTTKVNDLLKQGIAVILDLHKLDESAVNEALSYLCGAVYALDGTMEKIGDNVVLAAPKNIPVSDEIIDDEKTGGKDADIRND